MKNAFTALLAATFVTVGFSACSAPKKTCPAPSDKAVVKSCSTGQGCCAKKKSN